MGFKMGTSLDLSKIRGNFSVTTIAVGYSDEDKHVESGKSMAGLAELLSVGTDKIPARPHLEEGIEGVKQELKDAIRKYGWGVFKEAKPEVIGQAMKDGVEAYIFSGRLQANAVSTVKRKGFDLPLIDDFELVGALHYKVVKESGR